MACFHEPLPLGGVVAEVGALGVREQREYGQVLSLQSEFIVVFFFFLFGCVVWPAKSQFPDQGSNPR